MWQHQTQLRAEATCSPESTDWVDGEKAPNCVAEQLKNELGHRGVQSETGACRANTQVTNCTLTSTKVLVPQKSLISRRQGIARDHRHVFLWAVKTIHGINLNNENKRT